MADDKKISELEEATTIADANLFPIVTNTDTIPVTKKTLWNTIKITLKVYFDAIYAPIGSGGGSGNSYFPSGW